LLFPINISSLAFIHDLFFTINLKITANTIGGVWHVANTVLLGTYTFLFIFTVQQSLLTSTQLATGHNILS
jgi:hypothetical protein